MAAKPLLAALALLAVALAGCSDGGDGGGEGTTTSTSGSRTGTTSSGSSTSVSVAPNRPPEADLAATVNGTTAVFRLEGTDADNDTLSWSLDFGDGASENGTGLPQNVTHAYAAAGTFSANLTVSDGKANATASVQVVATAGGGASSLGQTASMAWDVGVTDQESLSSGSPYTDCADGPNKTFNYDSFELDLATKGLPFKATIADAAGGASIQSWTVYFNLADCSEFAATFSAEGAGAITGTIPEDAIPFVFVMATGGFLLEAQFMSGSQIV